MRHVIFSLVFFGCSLLYGQSQSNPFLKLHADSVVLYDYGGQKGSGDGFPIISNGKLHKSVRKFNKLEGSIAVKLTEKLGSTGSYGQGTAACFEPHLGIVYYKNTRPVGYVSICLDCNRLYASLPLNAQLQGKQGSGKDTYYLLEGMSKFFRRYLNNLVILYQFSHPIDPGSLFD